MFFFIYQLIPEEKNKNSRIFFNLSQKRRISQKTHETLPNPYASSYLLRLAEDGIFNKSRYFATVLREISMPSSFNRSTNF